MPSLQFSVFAPILNRIPEKWRLFIVFLVKQRRFLNLKEPKTFNEKTQYRKLYDRNPAFTRIADKLAVKDYVKQRAESIEVPEVYWSDFSLQQLDLHVFAPPFVLKANHASGTNFIINTEEDKDLNLLKLERNWRSLNLDKTFVEWAYQDIPIKFFIEEFIGVGEEVPYDYKFWVFGGRVEFVQVDTDRFKGHKRAFYDRAWNKLPFLLTFPDVEAELEKPRNFSEMIIAAEDIADGYDFLRVDLYTDGNTIYFGEITLYPDAGHGKFRPQSADLEVGKLWALER